MKLNEINSKKEFDFSCIYLWTNLVNNKKYVGQTQCFYARMSQYKKGFFNNYMKNSIEKYGVDNFEIIVLEKDIPFDKLDEREQYYLDYYESYNLDKGYNICQFASTTRGRKMSKEQREEHSRYMKEYFKNPKNKENHSGKNHPLYGKKQTKEQREKHSQYMKEKWQDEEYRQYWHNIMSGENNSMYGVSLVPYNKGIPCSQETKDKISVTRKKNLTKEHYDFLRKKILCIELDKTFDSMTDAAKFCDVTLNAISVACHNEKRTCHKYHWKIIEE